MIQIIDNKIREDVSLGREAFLNKYGLDKEELYDKITCENIREITKKALEDIKERKQYQMTYRTIKEYRAMSKIKDWLMEMEEDATSMSRENWVQKHGTNQEHIFSRVQGELDEIGQGELNLWRDNNSD